MNNSQNNNSQNDLNKRKKMKKRILIILAGLVAFIILFFLVIQNIDVDSFFSKDNKDKPNPTIIFYPINYDENIFNDTAYMDLDRNIYYYNGVETISINENGNTDYSNYEAPVEFLGNMVDLIISGSHEPYNECFSGTYYANEKNKPKDDFTMQKLYNITISVYSEVEVSNYNEYIYVLEYMIYKNNGTFRNDIGSDAIRKQYIKMTDRTGELLIDAVSNVTYTN